MDIVAVLKEDQWQYGSHLNNEDQYLPEGHLMDSSSACRRWQCNAAQKAKGRDTREITKETKCEACLEAISPQEIQAAMDADVCLAKTHVALHTKRLTDFKDDTEVMNFRDRTVMTKL